MSNLDNDDAAADTERDDNIQGLGGRLKIGLQVSTDVVSSDYLFNTLGSTLSVGTDTLLLIDRTIRVQELQQAIG